MLWILYAILVSLLSGGLYFLLKDQPLKVRCWVSCIGFFLCFSLYFAISQPAAVNQWLEKGREHYALLVEYQALGGIDGMISRIKEKLDKNPDDAEGWIVLGKLYLAQHNEKAAKAAFQHAGF